ncbi:Alpha/Beta hydrolase protein [Cyathus striatus]|nr:Alpha/Beta hydrolase protein [Cyathus striatus]
MHASLIIEKCHLEPSTSYPFYVLATRYSTSGSLNITERDGYTLIMTHGIGAHKETWEVTIRHFLSICNTGRSPYRVKELYSIENPNHGESALLNADIIQAQCKDSWSTMEYVHALKAFLSADIHHGARVNFSERKLVGIGHSMGALTLILTQTLTTRIPWKSIIIIEPGFAPTAGFPGFAERLSAMQRWVWLRRDTWLSKKHALKDLQGSRVFDQWDLRVLRLYVEYALSDHPASKLPLPHKFNGVVTSISRDQEAIIYRCKYLSNGSPLQPFYRLCAEIPVHLIWSDRDEVMLADARTLLSKPSPETGSSPASVRYVRDAGHMLVQQKPELIAGYIHEILSSMYIAVSVL